MSWLATLLAAIVSAVIGGTGTFGLCLLWVEWYRIPAREGQSGYFVVFTAIFGLIVGAVIGPITSRAVIAIKPAAAWFEHGLLWPAAVGLGLLALALAISWFRAPTGAH